MANTKKYVSLEKLGLYDEKIKKVIKDSDAATLQSAKEYAASLASGYDVAGAAATVQAELEKEIARAKAAEEANAAAAKQAQDEVDALETLHATDKAALEAKDTELANAISALDTKVGNLPEGTTAKDVVDYINIKTTGIATDATVGELQEQVDAIQGDVNTIKGDYLKAADKTELAEDIAEVQDAVEELAETHATDKADLEAAIALKADKTTVEQLTADAATKEALEAEVNRAKGEEARIEALVTAEVERATGVEADHKERIEKMEAFFKGAAEDEGEGESLKNALDTLVEIQTYVNTHGEAADQMVKDIAANKKAIEDHAKVDHDFAAADDALKTELMTEINKKADKTTVEGIDGRLTTAEGKITTVEGKVSTLEGKMTAVEAAVATKVEQEAYNTKVKALEDADAALAERLDDVEAMLGDGDNSVSEMIATAKQEAIDAAASAADAKDEAILAAAKKYADDEDAKIESRVGALETASATHALASDLTALAARVTTAEGEIDTLQSEMDAVEALAAANKAAHEANAAAIALKADITALNAVSDRVTALETWHANFVECSQEDINDLFD